MKLHAYQVVASFEVVLKGREMADPAVAMAMRAVLQEAIDQWRDQQHGNAMVSEVEIRAEQPAREGGFR